MNRSLLDTNWPTLLELVLPVLDGLPHGMPWSWGGGTALSIHLDHRRSYDIDIFVPDSRALQFLSPQRNPHARSLSDRWQEPGHYIKIEREEGEIDFIVSPLLTDPGVEAWTRNDRPIPLETVQEVLAKKLHWRGSRALARDVFDLAAAREYARESFAAAISAQPEGARRVADYIRRRIRRLSKELPLSVTPTKRGQPILNTELLELAAELDR